MKKTLATAGALLVTLALAGCAPSTPVTGFESLNDLKSSYIDAGGSCEHASETQTMPGNEAFICEDGSYLVLVGAENVEQGRKEAAGSSVPAGYSLIVGENWAVFKAITGDDAKSLASELGGEVVLGG